MAAQIRKLASADYVRTPWKNGLGETLEIARADRPGGAGGFDFDWRISVAPVTANGPFSTFPGIERTITVVDGHGMDLTFDTGERHLLRPFEPFTYDGGRQISGRLVDGPVGDLNVMTRRGRWASTFAIAETDALAKTGPTPGCLAILHVLSGQWRSGAKEAGLQLEPAETLVLALGAEVALHAIGPGKLAVIHLLPEAG